MAELPGAVPEFIAIGVNILEQPLGFLSRMADAAVNSHFLHANITGIFMYPGYNLSEGLLPGG